jgi:hypothetical protein
MTVCSEQLQSITNLMVAVNSNENIGARLDSESSWHTAVSRQGTVMLEHKPGTLGGSSVPFLSRSLHCDYRGQQQTVNHLSHSSQFFPLLLDGHAEINTANLQYTATHVLPAKQHNMRILYEHIIYTIYIYIYM